MSAAREQLAALLQEVLPYVAHRSDCPYDERSSSPASDFCYCRVESLLRRAADALETVGVSSLRAPQRGPWTMREWWGGLEGRWSVAMGDHEANSAYVFDDKRQAIAVCDALNRVAGSGAETPPQPTEEQNGQA